MTKDTDPIVAMAREFATLVEAIHSNDEARLAARGCRQERDRLEREHFAIWNRKEAIESLIANSVATSMEGALAQVVLIGGRVDSVLNCEPGGEDQKFCDEQLRDARRMSYSGGCSCPPSG